MIRAAFLIVTSCPLSGRDPVFSQLPLWREAPSAGGDKDKAAATGKNLHFLCSLCRVWFADKVVVFFAQKGYKLFSVPTRWMHLTHTRQLMSFWKSLLCTARNQRPRWLFLKRPVNKMLLLLLKTNSTLCCFKFSSLFQSFKCRIILLVWELPLPSSFWCPVSLCPATDAVLKKLLSASSLQSYCFLSTLLVMMGLLKVHRCYKFPRPWMWLRANGKTWNAKVPHTVTY